VLFSAVAALALLLIVFAVIHSNRPRFTGRLYYCKGVVVVERNLKTGREKAVLSLSEQSNKYSIDRKCYDISRDNRYIAFIEHRKEMPLGDLKIGKNYLVVGDIDKRKIVFMQPVKGFIQHHVSFSPDGKMIALISDINSGIMSPTVNLNYMLIIIRLKDGKTIMSVPADAGFAAWSPDGSKIAYPNRWGHVVIMNLADKKQDVLPIIGIPKWSPDGRYIVAVHNLWDVQIGDYTTLDIQEDARVLGWSADSKSLLFTYENLIMEFPICVYQLSTGKTSKIKSSDGWYDTYWRN
jgi:Tol biopolymer transport system component